MTNFSTFKTANEIVRLAVGVQGLPKPTDIATSPDKISIQMLDLLLSLIHI